MIFVFGSNLAGVHGAGAAAYAASHHDAEMYVGHGPTGVAYALPTKDKNIKTLPLATLQKYVDIFIKYARDNPDKEFQITQIGTGLAGYKPEQIAPMFKEAPDNCMFDWEWEEYLGSDKRYWGTFG